VESTPRGHLELVASRDGAYRVYLLDAALQTRPVDGASGAVKVAKGGYPEVPLTPARDHLEGKGPAHGDDHLAMVVTVVREGRPEVARFNAHLEAHGHGGGLAGVLKLAPCPEAPPAGLSEEACATQGGLYTLEPQGDAPVVVLASGGLEPRTALAPRVGQRVHVMGTVDEVRGAKRVVASGVMVEHDHTPFHGGTVAMSGDHHLEVLALKSGEVRVWVSNAFRQPVPLAELKGTVETGAGSAPLVPATDGQYLTGTLPAASGEHEVTVHLPMPGDPEYFIGFLLTPVDGPAAPVAPAPEPPKVDAAQEVVITVQNGYLPGTVTLKKGTPARLRFVRKDSGGCGGEVLIPDFGVRQSLPGLKETVVELTPDKEGTFAFTCGMQMMKGTLVVQ
jgi:hypothetical protein